MFQTITTDTIDVTDRFDFWRSCFLGAELDRPAEWARHPFVGHLVAGGRLESSIYQDMRNSSLTSRFGRRESGLVLLAFISDGTVYARHGDDSRDIFDRSSGLILFDCDRPIITYSTDISMCCLSLPRDSVMAALGRERSTHLAPMIRMAETGLAAVWKSLMQELSRSGPDLSEAGSIAAIQSASALAMAVLSAEATPANAGLADDALYDAACRVVRLNVGDLGLTSESLADRLGCSRSYLYRVFAERGQPIGAFIRKVRMELARDLLLAEIDTPVGLIAFRCGYSDPSSFGKAFRRTYDATPSELRNEALRGSTRPGRGQPAPDA